MYTEAIFAVSSYRRGDHTFLHAKKEISSDLIREEFQASPVQPSRNGSYSNANDVLTMAEVATILRCSKNHVSNVLNGKVPGLPTLTHFAMGRRKLVRREWLTEWMELHKK